MDKNKQSGTLLEIKDPHVSYNTDEAVVYAINGRNLTVERGETLGLGGGTVHR